MLFACVVVRVPVLSCFYVIVLPSSVSEFVWLAALTCVSSVFRPAFVDNLRSPTIFLVVAVVPVRSPLCVCLSPFICHVVFVPLHVAQ
jgi:hypothetical protein